MLIPLLASLKCLFFIQKLANFLQPVSILTGESFTSLSCQYRIGTSAADTIIEETSGNLAPQARLPVSELYFEAARHNYNHCMNKIT